MIIENFKPDEEQSKLIAEKLNYLSNAVDRLNRFDWNGLALSIVISISINLAVDTDGGRLLYKLFEQAFNEAIKLLPHHL